MCVCVISYGYMYVGLADAIVTAGRTGMWANTPTDSLGVRYIYVYIVCMYVGLENAMVTRRTGM